MLRRGRRGYGRRCVHLLYLINLRLFEQKYLSGAGGGDFLESFVARMRGVATVTSHHKHHLITRTHAHTHTHTHTHIHANTH